MVAERVTEEPEMSAPSLISRMALVTTGLRSAPKKTSFPVLSLILTSRMALAEILTLPLAVISPSMLMLAMRS